MIARIAALSLLLTGASPAPPAAASTDAGAPAASNRERDKATSALGAARKALMAVDGGTVSQAASARLQEAEKLFAEGRYPEAAAAADEAWKLVSNEQPQSTAFTVEVREDGQTRVTSRRGHPVRVEAQGVERPVEPGQTVHVEKGQPPAEPAAPPSAPEPNAPRHEARLKLKPDAKGRLGPVKLVWKGAARAAKYKIEVVPVEGGGEPLTLTSARAEVALPPLQPGRYAWTVRALGEGDLASEPSPMRSFSVEPAEMKLNVRNPGWKR